MEKQELPLLDEINELLIKERTLLGLKVVEQQIETQEWKQKYEALKNQITENKTDFEVFEIVGEMESNKKQSKEQPPIEYDLDRLLHFQYSSQFSWCINTCQFLIHRLELKKLLKYPKSYDADKITVLQLHHSDLQDSDSDLIMLLLINYSNLQCLDLSHNELGSEFRSIFLQTIQKRRLKLQYLLLDGNMPLSLFALESFVHHLSSQTWGLSVTLNDLENLTQYETVDKTLSKSINKSQQQQSSTSSSIPNLNLPPNIGHTVRLRTKFLRHLNFVLSPESQETKGTTKKPFENNSNTLNKTKNDFSAGFSTVVRKETHRGPDKHDGGIQFLCFLGLTHSKLSRESVGLLEQTLELSVASLTSLDLTYSFIGITGAEMIGRVLSNENCQIVHLNLTGNSIGDYCVKLMSESIKNTITLTYLNLQSNDITDRGLRTLSRVVLNHKILRSLIVESNSFDYNNAIQCQMKIQQSGSQTQLIWAKSLGFTSQQSSLPEQSHTSPIFTIDSQNFHSIDPITRAVNIYSIDSRHIRPLSKQFSSGKTQTKLLDDQNSSDELILVSWIMGLSEDQSEHSHLRESLLKTRLAWEIKCLTGSKVVTVSKRTLLPNACLPIGNRIKCSTTVPCPPLYSKLEIWVYVISNDTSIGSQIRSSTSSNRNKVTAKYQIDGGLKIESSHLIISRPTIYQSPHEFVYIGGDCQQWDSVQNTRTSLYDPFEYQHFNHFDHLPNPTTRSNIPEGFLPLRHLKWIGQPASLAMIQFRLKLSVLYGVEKQSTTENKQGDEEDDNNEDEKGGSQNNDPQIIHEPAWKTTNGNSLGYEWMVLRCRHESVGSFLYNNCYEMIVQGEDRSNFRIQKEDEVSEEDEEDDGKEEDSIQRNSVLNPWLWKGFEISVENISMNDSYLLVGRVIHRQTMSELSSQCIVSVSDWGMFLTGESFNGWEDLLDEVQEQNLLNGVWDDPSLSESLMI